MNNILIYTKNQCAQCNLKVCFERSGYQLHRKERRHKRERHRRTKATGYKSMPIILKDGQVIASGFMPDVLNQLEWSEAQTQERLEMIMLTNSVFFRVYIQ